LLYNRFKIATFDRLFFRPASVPESFYKLKEIKNPFLELNIDLTSFDEASMKKLKRWTHPGWTQDQFLIDYKAEGFIEPRVGWALTMQKRLIYPSLGFSHAPHVHKPSFAETYSFKTRNITRLDKVISLRDTGEENYFHFFNDILPKIYFLEARDFPIADFTLVISHRLYNKPYFQYFLTTDYFKRWKWYVQQPGEWIYFKESVFCKPYTHTKAFLDTSVHLCKVQDENKNHIFLTRSERSLRYIENMDDLLPILKKHQFKIIDASELSFQEQVNLFAGCTCLAGIHGAGLTNMIFRKGQPMSVLEIMHPFPYVPFHYIMLSKLYGHRYDLLLGMKGKKHRSGGFRVDPYQFELKLASLLPAE
jgi:capsular polysaccharide biosynthesis protein